MKKVLLFTDLSYGASILRGVISNTTTNILVNDLESTIRGYGYEMFVPSTYGMPGHELYPSDIEKIVVFGDEGFVSMMEEYTIGANTDIEIKITSSYISVVDILNIKTKNIGQLLDYDILMSIQEKLKDELINKLLIGGSSMPINKNIIDYYETIMNSLVKKGMDGLLGKNRAMDLSVYLFEAIGRSNYILRRLNEYSMDAIHMQNLNKLEYGNNTVLYGPKDLLPFINKLANPEPYYGYIKDLIYIDNMYIYIPMVGDSSDILLSKFEKTINTKHQLISTIVDSVIKKVAYLEHNMTEVNRPYINEILKNLIIKDSK